jgi:hypothetical protein
MAEKGTIVVTVDAVKEQKTVNMAFPSLQEFAKRSTRISLALTSASKAYPLGLDQIAMYGVVDGDYPRFLVNTGMMYAREFTQEHSDNGLTWFSRKDGDFSLYAPKNNTLIFTNASYEKAFEQVAAKKVLIDDQKAAKMANAAIAVYAYEPQTFFDLGLDLSQTVISQAKEMLLLFDQKSEGGYTMDAYISMDTPKLANTLSQMVRSGYLARLKKDRIPFKIADLMQMFFIEDDLVTIKHMDVGEEQVQLIKQSLTGLL